uniref:39S ribosomal protein L41, mitochondrial n=1 Tax=Panagrellus redivivus TaxID=6233 RepID=A0A7E4V4P4_PANRE
MVYPLSKFAYSFTRRLQELAIPTEALHLQLADVDQVVFKKPLKKPTYLKKVIFTQDHVTSKIVVKTLKTRKDYRENPEDKFNEYKVVVDDQLPDLFTAEDVEVIGFHLSLFFTHTILKRFAFHPSNICIHNSTIDDAAAELLLNCKIISFEKSCQFAPGLTVFAIVKNCCCLPFLDLDFDVIDSNFFSDLDKVFSNSKAQIDINVDCHFEDLKEKFTSFELPCYPANSLSTPDALSSINYASVGFHLKNVTPDEAKLFLKPFTNRPIGPMIYFFRLDPNGPIIDIRNEECHYTEPPVDQFQLFPEDQFDELG